MSAAPPAVTSPAPPRVALRCADARRPSSAGRRRCSAASPARSTAATTGSPTLVAENPELEGTSTTVTAVIFDGTQHRRRPRRRQPRLPAPRRRRCSQLTTRPHLRAEPDRRGPDHRGRGPGPPAPQPDPARGRRRARARARRVHARGRAPATGILLCSDGCSGVLSDERPRPRARRRDPDHVAVVAGQRRRSTPAAPTTSPCVVADVVDRRRRRRRRDERARPSTGPMLVGAAPRRRRRRATSVGRAARAADTGELEPIEDPRGYDGDVDPEEMRYAPRPPRRFTWADGSPSSRVIVLLAAPSSAFAGWKWSQTQYYVADDGDDVAIYQGIEATSPASTPTTSRRPARSSWPSCPRLRRPPGPRRHQRQQPRRRRADRQPPAAAGRPARSRRPGASRRRRPRRSRPSRAAARRPAERATRHPATQPARRRPPARPLRRDAMSSAAAEPDAPRADGLRPPAPARCRAGAAHPEPGRRHRCVRRRRARRRRHPARSTCSPTAPGWPAW